MKPELKQKIKKILRAAAWCCLVIGLFIMMGFASKEEGKMTCKSLKISIRQNDENFFVDERDIRQMIYDRGDSIINQPMSSIDISNLEKLMHTNPWVSNAEVYVSIGGELKIELEQRKPVLRVINRKGESFYIDTEGKLMLWSQKFTPRVLVASGNIPESYDSFYKLGVKDILANDSLRKFSCLDDLFAIAQYVSADEFWNAQTEQVFINSKNEIELVGRAGNQKIIFGDGSDMEEKFTKLKTFYKVGLNTSGWNTYDTLNLKYKNQVVAIKKKIELGGELNDEGLAEKAKTAIKKVNEDNAVEKTAEKKTDKKNTPQKDPAKAERPGKKKKKSKTEKNK